MKQSLRAIVVWLSIASLITATDVVKAGRFLLWQRVRESNPCTSLERAVSFPSLVYVSPLLFCCYKSAWLSLLRQIAPECVLIWWTTNGRRLCHQAIPARVFLLVYVFS